MAFPIVDIFAGPGGLGEGFASFQDHKGKFRFKNVLSIEKDQSAYQTLLLRSFYRQFYASEPPIEYWQYLKGEISKSDLFEKYPKQAKEALNETLCAELGVNGTHGPIKSTIRSRLSDEARWVLVGGPPCQAYSLAGRSRMRTTSEDFEADKRHFLYREYLRIIADHRPPVFVMENVKGLLSATHDGNSMVERILSDLKNPAKALKKGANQDGYRLYSLTDNSIFDSSEPQAFLVKAEEYGIPQARHRILILGIREDIQVKPETLIPSLAPSVEQVIGDLPVIRSMLSKSGDSLESWRHAIQSCQQQPWYLKGRMNGLAETISVIDEAIVYLSELQTTCGADVILSRKRPKIYSDWYKSGAENIITSHCARAHMPSDLHRYLFASSFAYHHKRSPKLPDFPKELLPAHKNVNGDNLTLVSFPDRFRVQLKDKPSTTITSHISKDGHYFIHYDPVQCRSLTVREAARLQTFPDSYKFEGNRTSQYHQVGNAVPPLLSKQIAAIVYDVLLRIKL